MVLANGTRIESLSSMAKAAKAEGLTKTAAEAQRRLLAAIDAGTLPCGRSKGLNPGQVCITLLYDDARAALSGL